MKRNVGAVDKALRVAIGIVLLSLLIPVGGTTHWWGLKLG